MSKLGHVTPSWPFLTQFCISVFSTPNFLFLSLVPLVMNLHAKFDVSSSNRSRVMEGDESACQI